MGQSLGLALYLLTRSRLPRPRRPSDEPARPRLKGLLIWLAVPGPDAVPAVAELISRIKAEQGDIGFLVTLPPAPSEPALPHGTHVIPPPADTLPQVREFLDHWQPDLAVFVQGNLMPALIDQTHARRIPLFLIDGQPGTVARTWAHWNLGMSRSLLQRFDRILAQDAAAARQFRRMGAPAWRLEVAGKLEASFAAMPCTEAERNAMAGFLRSRPVWLAVSVPEREEVSVINALRLALRLSHRLLLILVPEDPGRGPALADMIETELGLSVSLRSLDEDPDEEDHIYIADTEGEFGLWYRLAPVCYMGGTLLGGSRPRHPYEPAALGSAILHGPLTEAFSLGYSRLADASASRLARNAMELGEVVSDLLAPDRAAQLAHNAWSAATAGVEVTDRVVRMLLAALAGRGPATAKVEAKAPAPPLPLGSAPQTGRTPA